MPAKILGIVRRSARKTADPQTNQPIIRPNFQSEEPPPSYLEHELADRGKSEGLASTRSLAHAPPKNLVSDWPLSLLDNAAIEEKNSQIAAAIVACL